MGQWSGAVLVAEALGPILDALPELSVAVDLEAGASTFRLFQQVRGVLSESPMLLLLEDVHWADEATLDILRFLGRRLAGDGMGRSGRRRGRCCSRSR